MYKTTLLHIGKDENFEEAPSAHRGGKKLERGKKW